ncbi:MAG: glycerate kinase [Acidobacteriota bacterium]
MSLRILVAPSGFKESLGAEEVADLIEIGIKRVIPEAIVHKAPLVDGGEGFTKTLVRTTGGTIHTVEVTGPVGKRIPSHFGFLGGSEGRTAVLEMSAAAGLRLVPTNERNPLVTTTYGVGELIKAALDAGAERILIGCGDSGTNDGGAGMAQALGIQLLDKTGAELGFGGQYLKRLAKIDMSNRDKRLDSVQIDVACNWHNVLCGENGVARVFGPQKGASPETVQILADALDNLADVVQKDLAIDVRYINGGGASGGLGAGLSALIGAKLHPRFEIVMQYLELDELLKESDLVLTAEGGIDFQTPRGKIPSEVATRAKRFGLPVIALAGTVGKGAKINYEHGIDSFLSILDKPCSLSEAIENAPSLLKHAAERAMRFVMIGNMLSFSK